MIKFKIKVEMNIKIKASIRMVNYTVFNLQLIRSQNQIVKYCFKKPSKFMVENVGVREMISACRDKLWGNDPGEYNIIID